MSKHIWFRHIDYMGDSDDYSVPDWSAAKTEATRLVENSLGFVCDSKVKSEIESLLKTDWKKAVHMFNEHNAVKEHIAYCEGKKAY